MTIWVALWVALGVALGVASSRVPHRKKFAGVERAEKQNHFSFLQQSIKF